MMKLTISLLFFFGMLSTLQTEIIAGEDPAALEIIAAADSIRNPEKPFRLKTILEEFRSGKPQDRMVLIVYSKEEKKNGQYRSLVRFLEPERDQNKLMLKNGNILWFYDPASKSSVRLSPQQRLMGQASNGDVVTVNFAKDYRASLVKTEAIADAERKTHTCYKINLEAANDTITYDHIEYWVDTTTNHPIKGKFYSASGRLLKIVYYRKYHTELGKERPTETLIIDGVDNKLITRMTYSNYQFQDIPEEWFQKEYLPRFQGD